MKWAMSAAAVLSLGVATAAMGAAVGADDREQVMERAAKNGWVMVVAACDKDGNGDLSLAEFTVIQKNKAQAAEKFTVMDVNQDGTLVEEEYVAWVKSSVHPAGRQ
jgi:hypothetical protein